MSHIQQIGFQVVDRADEVEALALSLPDGQTGIPEAELRAFLLQQIGQVQTGVEALLATMVEETVTFLAAAGSGADLSAVKAALIEKADACEQAGLAVLKQYGYETSNWPEPGTGTQVSATKFNGPGTLARHATAHLDFPQCTILFFYRGGGTDIVRLGRGLKVSRWSQNSLGFSVPYSDRGLWYPALYLDNRWNIMAARYDRTTPSIKPLFRRNLARVTVFSPAPTTPLGTPTAWGPGYTVGDGSTGGLAQIQVFSRGLTEAEMDHAALNPGAIEQGLELWLPDPQTGEDRGPHGYHAEVVGLTTYAGGGPEGLYP